MGMKVNGTSGLTFPDTTTLASAGQASVRAWVNFNGTGTVAIRASYNVSSITDNGTGIYTLNFTNALSDADYAVVSMSSSLTGAPPVTMHQFRDTPATASSVKIYTDVSGTGQVDSPNIYAAVFR